MFRVCIIVVTLMFSSLAAKAENWDESKFRIYIREQPVFKIENASATDVGTTSWQIISFAQAGYAPATQSAAGFQWGELEIGLRRDIVRGPWGFAAIGGRTGAKWSGSGNPDDGWALLTAGAAHGLNWFAVHEWFDPWHDLNRYYLIEVSRGVGPLRIGGMLERFAGEPTWGIGAQRGQLQVATTNAPAIRFTWQF